MVSTKLYTAIYVVLFVPTTVQVLVEFVGLNYWLAFGVVMILSTAKAVLVATYFQHLRFGPRSLMYLVCVGFVTALALTLTMSYSLL